MEDILSKLNNNLLGDECSAAVSSSQQLWELLRWADLSSRIEGSLVVVSDIAGHSSYLFYGCLSKRLGIVHMEQGHKIDSIWEEDILSLVYPDDLKRKYALEYSFFQFVSKLPLLERSKFSLSSIIRMKDTDSNFINVRHRTYYVYEREQGRLLFAICIYDLAVAGGPSGAIFNSMTGELVDIDGKYTDVFLSVREVEVLRMIEQGFSSKMLADALSISVHTVNRHRQNILEKLQVSNSVEACRVAKNLGLI